jgi:hypothetical protein
MMQCYAALDQRTQAVPRPKATLLGVKVIFFQIFKFTLRAWRITTGGLSTISALAVKLF